MRELFLALLSSERTHGYELRQSLQQEFGDLLPALNAGQIYVTLGRLERDGLVKSAWENEADAHADGRPARRYYKLTAPGVKALHEAAAFYRSMLPAGRPRAARS